MDSSDADAALEAAERAFEDTRGQSLETGLDVTDEALVQLRKACRLLEAATTLRERNGHYTVVIETSFVAIERSIQFYLIHRNAAGGADLRHDHAAVYERAVEINLFSESFGDRLLELWKTNRAAVYYREAAATAEQADAMLELATSIHEHVLRFSSVGYECICNQ